MLSNEEKNEMLKDGESLARRRLFNSGKDSKRTESLDEYLRFLESIQKIFSPFSISRRITLAKYNKL